MLNETSFRFKVQGLSADIGLPRKMRSYLAGARIGVPFIMARIALIGNVAGKTDLFGKEVMSRRHGSGLMEFTEFGVVWDF